MLIKHRGVFATGPAQLPGGLIRRLLRPASTARRRSSIGSAASAARLEEVFGEIHDAKLLARIVGVRHRIRPRRDGAGARGAAGAAGRASASARSLDAPCGDGNWMAQLDYPLEHYTGIDVVPAVVEAADRRPRRARPASTASAT